jgi:hypothetical protein
VGATPQERRAPRPELRGSGFLLARRHAAQAGGCSGNPIPGLLALAYRMDITIGMSTPSITIMTGQKTRPSTSPLNFSQRFIF